MWRVFGCRFGAGERESKKNLYGIIVFESDNAKAGSKTFGDGGLSVNRDGFST